MEETMMAVTGLLLDLADGVHRDSFLLLYLYMCGTSYTEKLTQTNK